MSDVVGNLEKLFRLVKLETDKLSTRIGTAEESILGKAPAVHSHDDRYYTEGEVNTLLSYKSDNGHTHSQYLTSHQDISGKLDKSGGTMTGNLTLPVLLVANKTYSQSLNGMNGLFRNSDAMWIASSDRKFGLTYAGVDGYIFKYSESKQTYNIDLPTASGKMALTSDIPTIPSSLPANGGNADYATRAGYCDSLGNQAIIGGRDTWNRGLYTYNSYQASGAPSTFMSYVGFGNPLSGQAEIGVEWTGAAGLWFRAQGDWQNWSGWKQVIDTSNIGSQSVNYANSSGNADTLDGYHENQFVHGYKITKQIAMHLATPYVWYETGILSNNTLYEDGVYIVEVYVNSNGHYWSCHYTGLLYWYSGRTNNDDQREEIILHRTGHAANFDAHIYLSTKGHFTGVATLEIASNINTNKTCVYEFHFTKIG